MAALAAFRAETQSKLNRIDLQNQQQTALLNSLSLGAQIMSAEMDTLSTQVTQTDTVIDSAVTLLNGIAGQIQDAAGDRTKSLALAAELKTKSDALAAAVAANTPSQPPPAP